MEECIAADNSDVASAASGHDRSLAPPNCPARDSAIYAQPGRGHRGGPSGLELIVRGLQRIPRISCSADIGAKMHPGDTFLHDPWPAVNIGIDAKMAEFMTTGCHEKDVTGRLIRSECSHQFQPTGQTATSFTRARPPPASGGHHYERRQRGVGSPDAGGDVESLHSFSPDVRD